MLDVLARHGVPGLVLGAPNATDEVRITCGARALLAEPRTALQRLWAETTCRMQALRDNPESARQEYDRILDAGDPGLSPALTFDPAEDVAAPFVARGARPRMAILREQGVNGQVEMAAAFDRAGFESIDVHMSDVIAGRVSLSDFKGFAACGGFSYGDVLGGGEGWAKSILFNPRARDEFAAFFGRERHLRPRRLQRLPDDERAPRAHPRDRGLAALRQEPLGAVRGAPRARGDPEEPVALLRRHGRQPHPRGHRPRRGPGALHAAARRPSEAIVAMRFVDNRGAVTESYPYNVNGSPLGITGVTTADGRFTIVMPHPERVFRTVQMSWHPDGWGEDSPWMRLFRNARVRVG